MPQWFMRVIREYTRTLAGKLTLTIFMLMLTGSILSGLQFYFFQEHVMQTNLARQAMFVEGLIKRSLEGSMLAGRTGAIQEALESLGRIEGIAEIKILSPDGKVFFSSDRSGAIDSVQGGFTSTDQAQIASVMKGTRPEPEIIEGEGGGDWRLRQYAPILGEPSCFTASCHFHKETEIPLGVLYTNYDISEPMHLNRQVLMVTFIIGAIVVASLSLVLFFSLYKFVTRPVKVLEEGIRRLGEGDFDQPIELNTKDEMGRLAMNFNAMADEISNYKRRLENWAGELEREVEKKTAEIKETQEQLANAEKLASLGRLAAGVAHELNNPLTGVVTFAHLMLDRTPEDRKLDREDLETIIEQSNRCTKIIKGLLSFSRKGEAEKQATNLNELIENAVGLVSNQSAFYNVFIGLDLAADLKSVVMDSNQIQQVVLNLVTNAADAMNGEGRIDITTRMTDVDGEVFVEVEIRDTGPGIEPEHMNKILEPFFTTKSVGKGTGLGLPVSYGIVKRHGGDLLIHSKPGKGTAVTMRLPLEGPSCAPTVVRDRSEFQ